MRTAFPHVDFSLWLLLAAFVFMELLAIGFFFYLKRHNHRGKKQSLNLNRRAMFKPRGRVCDEMERLRSGGELNESLARSFNEEEKLLFEVVAIDALSNWAMEDRDRIRSMLIKLGYDEQCARRSMSGSISDSIRASTLLNLLHPESSPEIETRKSRQNTSLDTPRDVT